MEQIIIALAAKGILVLSSRIKDYFIPDDTYISPEENFKIQKFGLHLTKQELYDRYSYTISV